MKKLFLLLLLLPLLGMGLGGGLLSAQTVTVSNLLVTEGTPSTVTFDVSWERPSPGTVWMDSAWVFVDYNKNGVMTRLELLLGSGATLTDNSAPGKGALEEEPGNTSGAWVKGYAWTDGSFSATVQLLTATANLSGACAYASGYPPVGVWLSDSKLAFTGTPMYKITLTHTNGSTITVNSGGTFFLPCSYTISSFTDRTGAPGTTCMMPTDLKFTPSNIVACAGQTVTLTASATNADFYSINGTTWQTSPDFEVSPPSSTSYTLYAKTAASCVASAVDAAVVMPAVYPAVSPGAIGNAATTTMADLDPNVTIESLTDASGGSDNIAYMWVRTGGASPATLTGSAATYAIGTDASNYASAGTYYFNRYVQDATCNTAWVASAGTYTLNLEMSITLCEECCWDCNASAWVNCNVTTNAYPFENRTTNTLVTWMGGGTDYYPGATSDKNGRANTAAITESTGISAVQICKDLGPGWYLPAYEELYAMSSGPASTYSNNRAGADILGVNHWSSTEAYGNGGRATYSDQTYAVYIYGTGTLVSLPKNAKTQAYVRCAWRPLDNPTVSPGAITEGTAAAGLYTDPGLTITSASDATSGSGSVTYMWVRSGDSAATLTGSAATYAFFNDPDNYASAGTYYFNRYAKDAACNTEWVPSTGTYTLTVLSVSASSCPQCCFDGIGEVWVDCHVHTLTPARWAGTTATYGATSDKNGRANTNIITSHTGSSAAGACAALGEGWYLPAYEELYAMGWTLASSYSNNRSGAGLLTYKTHMSSSEYYNNTGQHTSTSESDRQYVLGIDEDAFSLAHVSKTGSAEIVCAWRPPDLMFTPSVATICEGQSQSVTLTATPAGAASYSIDGSTWQSSNTFSVSPGVTTPYPLYAQGLDGSTASVTVAAVVTVSTLPSAPTALEANITGICAGIDTPATLTATGGSEGSGAVYEWGTGAVGNGMFAITAENSCSVTLSSATTCWVRLRGTGACSVTTTTGATTAIDVFPAIEPGTITTASTTTTTAMDPPDIPVASDVLATGGSGSVTYMWVRSGSSSGTLTGSAATYNISNDVANYIDVGTFYFNRYAQDAACPSAAPVAEAGTYTLNVGVGLIVLCEDCCWDGPTSAWVNCYVPKITRSVVGWSYGTLITYYDGATSDRDGRANTKAITSYLDASAVGMCNSFYGSYRIFGGYTGWYLPAYEELVNMGDGTNNTPYNGRPGADLIGPSIGHWSSTEYYNNVKPNGEPGRHSGSDKTQAVIVYNSGQLNHMAKGTTLRAFCVWRPPND